MRQIIIFSTHEQHQAVRNTYFFGTIEGVQRRHFKTRHYSQVSTEALKPQRVITTEQSTLNQPTSQIHTLPLMTSHAQHLEPTM